MSAIVFDGTSVARERELVLAERVRQLLPYTPGIASVVCGEDVGSQLYTRLKKEAAERVGIRFERIDVSITDDVSRIQEQIQAVCARDDIGGVLIQKPSKRVWLEKTGEDPVLFDAWWHRLTGVLEVAKDVDCLTLENLQKVFEGEWQIVPATVKGVLVILEQALPAVMGKNVVVVGRSEIVGKPLAAVLEQAGAQVSLCGQDTEDLAEKIGNAEIVVSATGRPSLITGEMLSPGAIVVDVGSPGPDVDFETAREKASFITPVPEGVGPMTVVCLLENLLTVLGKDG